MMYSSTFSRAARTVPSSSSEARDAASTLAAIAAAAVAASSRASAKANARFSAAAALHHIEPGEGVGGWWRLGAGRQRMRFRRR